MKKTTITSNEQGRSSLNWRKVLYTVWALGLFFSINLNRAEAQSQCVMTCTNSQVSVDENCEALITYDMVSTPSQCSGNYLVEVIGSDGLPIPNSPLVESQYVDQTLTVRVIDMVSGNFCWSTIAIEDKMPPQFDCQNDTMTCWQMIEYDIPFVYDNCTDPDDIEVTLLNETSTLLDCDPDFIKTVTRSYVAVDDSGNESSVCEKTYYLERINFDLIEFPNDRSVADTTAILCDAGFPEDGNGNPHPSFTGVPTIEGIDLFPISGEYCNILVTYHDVEFPITNCKEKIMRTWTVREWWCSQEIVETSIQVIEIVDVEGPEIICPADLTVTTSSNSCSAGVFLAPADVDDNCNDIKRVDVVYPGGFLGDSNGGFVELPVGDNLVTYTAYDECLNSSSCSINVTVEDNTPPIAVCNTVTVVSLGSDGLGKVYAEVFDNGSHDECGIDYFEVARMNHSCGYDDSFGPYVEFSCCDIEFNLIMVTLRVYDDAGNFNDCMVEVEVQDKLPAAISCPPDITVACEFPIDPDNLDMFGTVVPVANLSDLQDPNLDPRNDIIIDDPYNPETTGPFNWGLDGFAYDNCSVEVTDSEEFDIDQCGEGEIRRTFTAEGPGGPSSFCVQTIKVKDFFPFGGLNDIVWPADVTIQADPGMCDPGDLTPAVTGEPIINSGICDLIGVNDPEDEIFFGGFTNDPACFKILRTWKVIDWCEFNSGTYTVWEHTQTIKVINNDAPEFTTDCEDVVVCSYDDQCSATFIELIQEAEDECTEEQDLEWTYKIDIDNTGSFDYDPSNNPFAAPGNAVNEASGTYPIGIHRIVWTVEDLCGNKSTCTQLFEIRNCKQPSPVCLNGLAAELMPMDLSGDGQADWAEIELNASMFDKASHHPCGYDVTLSFSSDPDDQTRLFDCDSLGQKFVEIWVTDENGNQDFCITYVIIQDNNGVCPNSGTGGVGGAIAGMIMNESEEAIEEVEVQLEGTEPGMEMTTGQGFYAFPTMPFGGEYEVVPKKNDNYLNGVTTFDIALIQRHILQISPIVSPYKLIAADINNDGEISILDVADLRSVILGKSVAFSNNNSWRFIDKDHQFVTNNPLQENFAESYFIPSFSDNMFDVNFTGVKIGDINNSAKPNSAVESEGRSDSKPFAFHLEDQFFTRGELVTVDVRASGFTEIFGFQGTVLFDTEAIELRDIKGYGIDVSDKNFGFNFLDEGMMTTSWSDPYGATLKDGENLFQMTFIASKDGYLSDHIFMGSSITKAEIYRGDEILPLEFQFDDISSSEGYVLFQNRPNPFKDETIIAFKLPEDQNITLSVFDVTGKLIHQVNGFYFRGYNEIQIGGNQLNASGVLYYRLDADNFNASRKMIILN